MFTIPLGKAIDYRLTGLVTDHVRNTNVLVYILEGHPYRANSHV